MIGMIGDGGVGGWGFEELRREVCLGKRDKFRGFVECETFFLIECLRGFVLCGWIYWFGY